MIALGMAVTWGGYYLLMYGYCLVRGYDVTFVDLFKARWPGPAGQAGGKLPLPVDAGTGTALA